MLGHEGLAGEFDRLGLRAHVPEEVRTHKVNRPEVWSRARRSSHEGEVGIKTPRLLALRGQAGEGFYRKCGSQAVSTSMLQE